MRQLKPAGDKGKTNVIGLQQLLRDKYGDFLREGKNLEDI